MVWNGHDSNEQKEQLLEDMKKLNKMLEEEARYSNFGDPYRRSRRTAQNIGNLNTGSSSCNEGSGGMCIIAKKKKAKKEENWREEEERNILRKCVRRRKTKHHHKRRRKRRKNKT